MSKALTCLTAGLFAALVTFPLAPALAQGYEGPPTFSAAKVLPPELLQSPYHKIVGPVTVQGFLNRYQMQTKYGTFTVEGTELLRMRVHELLKRTGTRPGHIFNLGHGILPETPVENVKACVEIVREFKL